MKEGKRCSLQLHESKHETIYILSGKMRLIYEDTETNLYEGEFFVIENGKVHRMCGITDCVYIEVSTSQLDDIIRFEDDFGRK